MTSARKLVMLIGLAAVGWAGYGGGSLVATADAYIGAPVTPVNYAGVARRSTVGFGAPGAGARPGVGAPGLGAAPANRGGPVNRVGVR